MAQNGFGTGDIWAAQTQDAYGNTVAFPTNIKFGELQDVGVDFSRDIKLLHGQLMMPVAAAGGKMKIDIKAKLARISGRIFNDLFFGQGMQGGTLTGVLSDTTGALIPASPHQVTVVPPAAGTFVRELGVIDDSGRPMQRDSGGALTSGKYVQSAGGIYTFAAADVGKRVFINYVYSTANATAQVTSIVNLPMGFTPTFGMDLAMNFRGKQTAFRFPNCVSGKLGFSPKQDDFSTIDMDISVFADAAGVIGQIITSE